MHLMSDFLGNRICSIQKNNFGILFSSRLAAAATAAAAAAVAGVAAVAAAVACGSGGRSLNITWF